MEELVTEAVVDIMVATLIGQVPPMVISRVLTCMVVLEVVVEPQVVV